jgi:flagellar export protein FliJ
MTREDRLRPLANLAKTGEERAAIRLAQARQRCDDQQRCLAELQRFQREYHDRFIALCNGGVALQRLNEYRRFDEKLTEAISQQSRVVEECRRQLDSLNRQWAEASARRRALDKTIERFQAETVRGKIRNEQREADELGIRAPSRD